MVETWRDDRPFIALLMITVILSSIVFIEPAPYDLFIVLLFIVAIMKHFTVYTSVHFWPVLSLFLFTQTNFLSLYFVKDMKIGGFYLIITIYCAITWLGFVSICSYFGTKILYPILISYVIAALIVVIPGMIAYFSEETLLDIFLYDYSRVKGLFKDPNVFGPFLVPPSLFLLWQIGRVDNGRKASIVYLLLFIILACGVLLSFSRAAWGNFIIALGIYFLINNDRSTKKLKTIFILITVLVPVLIYMIFATKAGELFFHRTTMQQYDEQRFSQQGTSLDYIYSYPLGFGPGQSELYLSQSTHSLFVRLISENGIFGLLFFSLFILITIIRGFYMIKNVHQNYKIFFVIVTASLIGILFNSIFIDTIHWRHFWLLLALPWMVKESEFVERRKVG